MRSSGGQRGSDEECEESELDPTLLHFQFDLPPNLILLGCWPKQLFTDESNTHSQRTGRHPTTIVFFY